jgi:hypothetical protein
MGRQALAERRRVNCVAASRLKNRYAASDSWGFRRQAKAVSPQGGYKSRELRQSVTVLGSPFSIFHFQFSIWLCFLGHPAMALLGGAQEAPVERLILPVILA